MEFHCEICGKGFYVKRYLKAHEARVHGASLHTPQKSNKCFPCKSCEKVFGSRSSLWRHSNLVHSTEKTLSVSCQETGCTETFLNVCNLRAHLSSIHKLDGFSECINLQFGNETDFYQWLAEEEKKTNSKFVSNNGKQKNKDFTYHMFICNRSGVFKPKIERTRQLKAQGTRKIGFHCTSCLIARDYGTHLTVEYYSKHYNHDLLRCHIPIPNEEKEIIAGKLLQRVQDKQILEDVRGTLETSLERKHLMTRQDIQNVKRDFGVRLQSQGTVLSSDVASVSALVNNLQEEDPHQVLSFKSQDDDHLVLNKQDFFIAIMTKFQRNMLQQFGADRVCVDSTHGITGYQYELVTLLIVDEYEEGVPVAFCITSTVDTKTLTYFFNCIKDNLKKNIHPLVFMSDDAPMFYNAWCKVFGASSKRLLCAWHVDRAWQKKLNLLKSEIRSDVYKTLKTLMYELNIEKFNQMLSNFIELLSEDESAGEFLNYFKQYYNNRREMWAYCHRKLTRINTNMYLESFHRTLKHIYLEGKKTKRVDKVIMELLKLARDKCFDNFIKSEKGKITKKATQNFKRHKEGKDFEGTLEEIGENEWKVLSSEKEYFVTKLHDCKNECIIACRNCYLCLKSHQCTCHDYVISNFLCKHIHFVVISLGQESTFVGPLNSLNMESTSNITADSEALPNLNYVELIKKNMVSLTSQLGSVDAFDKPVYLQINQHLKALRYLFTLKTNSNILKKSKNVLEPTNKKIICQKRFYSVKKSRSCKKPKLSKPTQAEVQTKKDILLKKELLKSSDESFDHNYQFRV